MAIGAVRSLSPRQTQTAVSKRIPAPYRGIDARSPLAAGDGAVCIYSYNLVPSDGGVALRKGYREWQIDLDDGAGVSVNTVMPYDGLLADGSEDRLFAVTNEGIWDVTVAGGTPSLKYTFPDQSDDAGYGMFVTFVTDAGDKTMWYADSVNGLFFYDVDLDTWSVPAGITGVDVTKVNFITVHKERIWLIERESPDAYYLGVAAIAGAATQFYFGSKLKNGGALRGLFSWTVNNGDFGVDALLVGVSGAGDVVIYQGADPATDDWTIAGVYFIGNLPLGQNFATEQSGELYILSTYGVTSMSDLMDGISITSVDAENTSARIAGQLRARMATQSDLRGWSIRSIPSEGGLLINSPTLESTLPIQYYYNITVGGWGLWRDLDIRSFGTWKNAVMFGDGSLRVLAMDREVDDVKITEPPAPEINGTPIQFSILSSYSPLGDPAMFKRVKFIRPDVISNVAPTFAAAPRFDYTLTEADLTLPPQQGKSGIWDVDNWDSVVWGASSSSGWNSVYGGFGKGRNVAVAYRGQTYNAFTLVGWDVIHDTGGLML